MLKTTSSVKGDKEGGLTAGQRKKKRICLQGREFLKRKGAYRVLK